MEQELIEKRREKVKKYQKERFNDLGIDNAYYRRVIAPMIKQIKGDKCEECSSEKMLDVHHTDYNNVNIHTVKLLCRKCHKRIHPKDKRFG